MLYVTLTKYIFEYSCQLNLYIWSYNGVGGVALRVVFTRYVGETQITPSCYLATI